MPEEIKKEVIEEKKEELSEQIKMNKVDRWLLKLSRVPTDEKLFFVQNLHVMIHAGLSISRALKTLALQTTNKYFKTVIFDINKKVEKGTSFSDALKNHPRVFNELFVNMIASGEVSGNLENVLEGLYAQMKKDHDLISKVKGALIYPSVVIAAMLGIGTFMMIFVMPKIIAIFKDIEADLPFPTRMMIGLTNIMENHAIYIGIGVVLLVIILIRIGKTKKGKKAYHWLLLHGPIVKKINSKINIARFARTLSSLLKTEVSIVQALEITSRTVGNVYYKEALMKFSKELKTGSQLNQIMAKFPNLFPPLIVQMTLVGEESGTIDEVLEEIAQFYESDVDQTMSNFPALIEPILILILGVGVGFIAVSVLLPMYNLTQSI